MTTTQPSALLNNLLSAKLPDIEAARGVWLTDTAGRTYLDGCSGAVVASIGHADPHVLDVMAEQSRRVTFTHRGAFGSRALARLADRLGAATGYPGVWFVNSGSEAVEAAIQFALQYFRERGEPRSWFLSSARGYHGNTLGGLSLSGHARREVAGELAYPFNGLPVPDAPRDGTSDDLDAYTARLLDQAEEAVRRAGTNLAGVVIEPVGGATLGAVVPPPGYLAGLRRLCDEAGALLITDEVMTGLGRCGHMLALDGSSVRADLVAIGKGLGAGYTPIAATLVSGPIRETIAGGSGRIHGGHTYAGNPLSVAIADAVLDVLFDQDLVHAAAVKGEYLADGLRRLEREHELVTDARGLGMLRAIELAGSRCGAPPGAVARALGDAAMRRGLVLYPATGGFNDAVLIAPPLTISNAEIDDLLERLGDALTDVEAMP